MKRELELQLHRLQDNLPAIRKIAGWRAIDLGELIGVTKQSVSNLETHKSRITLMQYISVRHMVDYHAKAHPQNKALALIVPLLLDCFLYDETEYCKVKQVADEIANAAFGGVSDSVLSTICDSLLSGINRPSALNNWTALIVSSMGSEQE